MEPDTTLSYIKERISTSLYCSDPFSLSLSLVSSLLGIMKMNAIVVLLLLVKVAVSIIKPIPNADKDLHIYSLPVGQGDCTVIQCPRAKDDPPKGTVTIIDAGSSTDEVGMDGNDIVDFLKGTTLRAVFLTHADADHLKYMDPILNYYGENGKKFFSIYHPCSWNKYGCHINSVYGARFKVSRCVNIKSCRDKMGWPSVINLCPNYQFNTKAANSVKLSIVASAYGKCEENKANNEDSLIVKITYGKTSTLITGDFELSQSEMKEFLSKAKRDLKSDIFQLSHHGAYNKDGNLANQIQFLNAVNAKYVFSSSFGYKYGHPRCEIYDYYKGLGTLTKFEKSHRYTCYCHIDLHEYEHENKNCKMAMYVTSIKEKRNGETVDSFCVIQFNVQFNSKRSTVSVNHCLHKY